MSKKFDKRIFPPHPDQYYKNRGWINWDNFFMKKENLLSSKPLLPFHEAREYARKLQLKHEIEWKKHYERCYPYYANPIDPKKIYQDEWVSWHDWLGIEQDK